MYATPKEFENGDITLKPRWRNLMFSIWKRIECFPFALCRRNLKTEFSLWKRIKCFPSTLRQRNLKTKQSPVILDLCFRKTPSGKSRDYRDVIVFQNFSSKLLRRILSLFKLILSKRKLTLNGIAKQFTFSLSNTLSWNNTLSLSSA